MADARGRPCAWAGAAMTNEDLETALAERVVQTLTPLVGAEHVKSSVTIDYDPTSGETTQETYDPNQTAVLTSQLSQETLAIWNRGNSRDAEQYAEFTRGCGCSAASQSGNHDARHSKRKQNFCGE